MKDSGSELDNIERDFRELQDILKNLQYFLKDFQIHSQASKFTPSVQQIENLLTSVEGIKKDLAEVLGSSLVSSDSQLQIINHQIQSIGRLANKLLLKLKNSKYVLDKPQEHIFLSTVDEIELQLGFLNESLSRLLHTPSRYLSSEIAQLENRKEVLLEEIERLKSEQQNLRELEKQVLKRFEARSRLFPEVKDFLQQSGQTQFPTFITVQSSQLQANQIYRFALPKTASNKDRREFRHSAKILERVNPGWAVIKDMPQLDEQEAIILLRKDNNYLIRRAAYLITMALSRTFQGGYGR
jgi:hypothetical protein